MLDTSQRFNLPDTGQIRCYDEAGNEIDCPQPGEDFYGQNGCFIINPFSYTKLGKRGEKLSDHATWDDGYRMLLDNHTGLMWEVKSPHSDDVNFCNDEYSWQDAQEAYISKLNAQHYGGCNDWRLPNKDELRSIVDYSRSNPAVDEWYFPNCQVAFYWCSITYEMQRYFGWGIFFGLGSGIAYGKSNLHHVRAVRGGYSKTFGQPDQWRFKDNGDGTITDSCTGLMWQKGENERMSWFEAIRDCENMRLAGYSDWRLPNIKELNTILNLTYEDGWWYHKDAFPAEGLEPPLLHYFSSTTYETTYVWVTNFCFGYDGYYANKNAKLLFRAVRSITPTKNITVPFKLPDSGQVTCYDDEGNQIPARQGEEFYGQDGCYHIHPLSFTKLRENGNALEEAATWEQGYRMVKDNHTGLIWEVKSPDPGDVNFKEDTYIWQDVQEVYIANMNKQNYGGFGDWRLPNREELRSMVNYDGDIPAAERTYFPHCLPTFYWSTDSYGSNPAFKWGIYFAYGCAICYSKNNLYHVRAVRSGYHKAFGDSALYAFEDNGDGTITDLNTGLMWRKDESPEMNWEDALHYCETLSLARYSDWRLPHIKELATLLDLSCKDSTWFHKTFFPNVKTLPLGFYWASTTHGDSFGWGINFQFGYDGYYAGKKHGCYPFRPVRSVTIHRPATCTKPGELG